ncbi:hypothetical protein LTR62_004215 [Meristemomyces frigidus]|uniref:Autophagy-related protein 14 n=1 Tax=Meristemomyces frigidus TaxID=1508187 RepID=A0AAN7THS0_9PEZI|nr:hypothetical protein LTR62_004215 [Meristemomyces frigidus]
MAAGCTVCFRDFNDKRNPTCASCAQAILYNPRIDQVGVRLQREKHHTHVDAIVRPGNDGIIASLPQDTDFETIAVGIRQDTLRKTTEERRVVEARIEDMLDKAEQLRTQLQHAKEWVAGVRKSDATRRSEIAAEKKQLQKQHSTVIDPVLSATAKARQRLEKVHNRTVDARFLLCRESALLAGLEKRKEKDGKVQYWLGGAPIVNLRHLARLKTSEAGGSAAACEMSRNTSHELISTGLGNVCRLLVNCCHYLSVRLPAQIILPYNTTHNATILLEEDSYEKDATTRPLPPTHRSAILAAARPPPEIQKDLIHAPRSLQFRKPLSQLFKEDHDEYMHFTEGAMLLAYDVAWLCASQGLNTIDTMGKVCNIGKSLYDLFLADDRARPPLLRNISGATTRTEYSRLATIAPDGPRLGAWSHGTAHHSLTSAVATSALVEWQNKLPTTSKLVERLQSLLTNEISGLEWDVVTVDREWDGELEREDTAVIVGGGGRHHDMGMSVMSVRPSDGAEDDVVARAIAVQMGLRGDKGGSGWMRVRSRGGEG